MLKTWKLWKTFFTTYLALVAGIWGVIQVYGFFREDELKKLFDSNWLIVFYIFPLFIAFSVATLTNKEETQAETLDQRNRRVMLNHVENFWVKGILEKSLHGAVLLELGVKENPNAINYPWTMKRESTNETLPAGKSMLDLFEEIGGGRSLLILGAPGSGKTTMLLELTRELIQRARRDETEPIPVIFNLASWIEKQTLADWLAEQLNIVYYVPKKTAPTWVRENKMLLLLDGLDEVKQESQTKCVEALNQFRNECGLTSLVVCSRIEEYRAINTKLSLEGAITLQPLTPKQINDYFDMFGNSLASVRLLLRRDKILEELAETPLMLSIMTLAYEDTRPEELLASRNIEEQRKHLFNAYIERMFERTTRMANSPFEKQKTLRYLSWLAREMIQYNIVTYQIEAMQLSWVKNESQRGLYGLIVGSTIGLIYGLIVGVIGGLIYGLIFGLIFGLGGWLGGGPIFDEDGKQILETTRPGQRLTESLNNAVLSVGALGLSLGLVFGVSPEIFFRLTFGLVISVALKSNITIPIKYYSLRFVLTRYQLLPGHLISFLEHAVALIFLRRVGGSYIFTHRLLMEHFAEMEVDKP